MRAFTPFLVFPMTTPSPAQTAELNSLTTALDALAADARGTDAARERMLIALATSHLALCAPAAFDESVLCLDGGQAESYSIEEAREKANRRKPKFDLLAAGLEKPAKKK